MKNIILKLVGLVLSFACMFNLYACSTKVNAVDLMDGITAEEVESKKIDDEFLNSQFSFSVNFFKEATKNIEENVFVSPLSAELALAMTANGASGKTLKEFENLFGTEISDLNKYLRYYQDSLTSGKDYKLKTANSIWYRDFAGFKPSHNFLQTNASYYNADAFKAPFDDSTVKDINNWVSNKTDGLIDKMIDGIDSNTVMYLINAILFEAKWADPFNADQVSTKDFTAINGEKQKVEMMQNNEFNYIGNDDFDGFIKGYTNKYSFAALLPKENININTFIQSLDGKMLKETLKNPEMESVSIGLPKFTTEYTTNLNTVLNSLGLNDAFGAGVADFSKMTDGANDIYIGSVFQKTFIKVNETGTKAAAATGVEAKMTSASREKIVILNRPFVYMIIDNTTKLPIFMGVMVRAN